MSKVKKIGKISHEIIKILGLPLNDEADIFIGDSNIIHMKNKHPKDYLKYGSYISDIIKTPDYVGINKKDNSIEYIKSFYINNEYVKVAIRVSNANKYFVRSLYVVNTNRTQNFINKGTLKSLTK